MCPAQTGTSRVNAFASAGRIMFRTHYVQNTVAPRNNAVTN